jgi:hypothetical protein
LATPHYLWTQISISTKEENTKSDKKRKKVKRKEGGRDVGKPRDETHYGLGIKSKAIGESSRDTSLVY